MDNILFENRLSFWYSKAKREKDPWVRFLLYYIIFDAYITQYSGQNKDAEKLKWFIENSNSLRDSLSDSWTTKLLPEVNALKSFSPIQDMRPNPSADTVLKDTDSYKEIFNFIYQIRCNLFHGSKDLRDSRDSNLVFHGGQFLKFMIDWWIVKK